MITQKPHAMKFWSQKVKFIFS